MYRRNMSGELKKVPCSYYERRKWTLHRFIKLIETNIYNVNRITCRSHSVQHNVSDSIQPKSYWQLYVEVVHWFRICCLFSVAWPSPNTNSIVRPYRYSRHTRESNPFVNMYKEDFENIQLKRRPFSFFGFPYLLCEIFKVLWGHKQYKSRTKDPYAKIVDIFKGR